MYCFFSQGEIKASLTGMTEVLSLPTVQCGISISKFWLIKQENMMKKKWSVLTQFFHLFHEILLT